MLFRVNQHFYLKIVNRRMMLCINMSFEMAELYQGPFQNSLEIVS